MKTPTAISLPVRWDGGLFIRREILRLPRYSFGEKILKFHDEEKKLPCA